MQVRIVSIKSEDNLKGIINSSTSDCQKIFFPTFGLVIEDISIDDITNRIAELKSLVPFFIERTAGSEKIIFIGDLNSFENL